MNPRGRCSRSRRVGAHVNSCRRVSSRRADHVVLRHDAILANVAVAHLDRCRTHHTLLKVEVQRPVHRQLVLDHLKRRSRSNASISAIFSCCSYNGECNTAVKIERMSARFGSRSNLCICSVELR